jgi:DNA-directed RNA polymerase subunit K/omega
MSTNVNEWDLSEDLGQDLSQTGPDLSQDLSQDLGENYYTIEPVQVSGIVGFPLDRLTSYEITAVLSRRVSQLEQGMPTEIKGIKDPYRIALEELKHGLMPLYIIRKYPSGFYDKIQLYGRSWNVGFADI